MLFAKQSTAATLIVGPILDSAGAEYTGAVIGDLSINKNGTEAAMASAATLTHVSNGHYTLVMTTGNTDTLGRASIRCNKSTYQMPTVELMVMPATVFDALVTNATTAVGGLGDIQRMAGTTLTARDIGASVLLSSGTGTGQVKLSSGYVAPNWGDVGNPTTTVGLSGTTVKEATDVQTTLTNRLVGTIAAGTHNAQSGDSYARIGATGSGLTSLAPSATALSTAQWTNTRAGYLDNLSAGAVALASSLTSLAGKFTGITTLANWLGAMMGKTADTTTRTEINATTAGAGYNETTDSLEANRDNIGTAGAGLTAIDLPDQTMNITGNITGNLSGSVGSVTGAVGSVTGNVGGNVAGSVGSVTGAVGSVTGNVGGNVVGSVASVTAGVNLATNQDWTGVYSLDSTGQIMKKLNASSTTSGVAVASINTDAVSADAVSAAAVTKIQNGLATAVNLATANAALAKLDDTVEDNGGTYRFTVEALENAPAGGGGGGTDWTANERTAIRTVLGIPTSGTTPTTPSAGVMRRIYLKTDLIGTVGATVPTLAPTDGELNIVAGDAYANALGNPIDFSIDGYPDITAATVTLGIGRLDSETELVFVTGSIVSSGSDPQTIRFELTEEQTALLDPDIDQGKYGYAAVINYAAGERTVSRGEVNALRKWDD